MITAKDISVVIPSNRDQNYTDPSVPDGCEKIISRSKPLGKARNDGIARATRKWIIVCDDDITFSKTFFDFVCEQAREDRIIGVEGYFPSPFIIGRFMCFSKSAWLDLGKFDEEGFSAPHGNDTEWCMRAVLRNKKRKRDYKIIRLSRDCVYHYPHKKNKNLRTNEVLNLLYLLRKHLDFPIYILKLCFRKFAESRYDEEYE